MKFSELISELTIAGCYLVRHGKSHDVWYSPITNKRFPIGRHNPKKSQRVLNVKSDNSQGSSNDSEYE